jgi:hypothetical protein
MLICFVCFAMNFFRENEMLVMRFFAKICSAKINKNKYYFTKTKKNVFSSCKKNRHFSLLNVLNVPSHFKILIFVMAERSRKFWENYRNYKMIQFYTKTR